MRVFLNQRWRAERTRARSAARTRVMIIQLNLETVLIRLEMSMFGVVPHPTLL